MKNNVITVMSKEFARFFGDKRMIALVFLPAVLIYVVYSFMGSAMTSLYMPDEDYTPTVYAVNMPESIAFMSRESGFSISNIESNQVASIKEQISIKEADLLIIFPVGFDSQVAAYDVQTATGPAPNVEVYYNSTVPNSSNSNYIMLALLDAYESALANKFDVNRSITDSDLVTLEDRSASFISMLMPMLLMLFLYSGCAGLAPESIAGEKERGTLATLLVTPLKRSELAAGKILSLCVLSFMSGIVTAVATILSLPNLMGGEAEGMIDTGIYGAGDYAALALIIVTTILLIVALISIISAFAKTVKEATTAVMPLMIIVMLVGVSGMLGSAPTNKLFYLIPLYSSVQCMSGIFSLDYSGLSIVISCVSSLVYALVGGFVLTRMFNSEKVMFSK